MSRIKPVLCMLLFVCFSATFAPNAYARPGTGPFPTYFPTYSYVPSVQERVEAGASFLDEVHPGWDKEINLAELNMKSSTRCILGQVYGLYNKGMYTLRITTPVSRDLGFSAFPGTSSAYRLVTAEWKKLIKKRRAKAEQ